MAKSLFEELGGKYERQGDYLIPCLTVPAEEEQAIGIWGQRHLDYLKQYRKVTYTNLLTSGRLNAYLADINRQAQERFERLIEGMKQAQGITEQLKAENALEWTGCLNPGTIQGLVRGRLWKRKLFLHKQMISGRGKSSTLFLL